MSTEEFSLTSSIKNNHLVIQTNGYINVTGGEKIAEEAYKHIDDGITNLVLDLENSRVVNSVGISILLEIIEKLEEVEGKLYLMNLTPTIEKTFKIMGIFKYAEKIDSLESLTS